MLKFAGSLNFLFHNLSIYQFSQKNTSLAQFIPRIYNKIIIKILGYFLGVTSTVFVFPPHMLSFHVFNRSRFWVVSLITLDRKDTLFYSSINTRLSNGELFPVLHSFPFLIGKLERRYNIQMVAQSMLESGKAITES